MFAFLQKLLTARSRIAPAFAVDESGITTLTSEGLSEQFPWKDVRQIVIVTTDQGPWSEDIFFVVEGIDGHVVVPHEKAVKLGLLHYLQKLPGFDNEAVIQAMSCTENNSFLCWSSDRAA
jgi:hypothetical protein